MGRSEDGQISVLLAGMVAVALTLILGVVGVTAVQLSRIQLLDAADAAALDASDEIAEEIAYREGVGEGIPLTDQDVAAAAADHLATRELPSRVTGWAVVGDTGTPDGRTAMVVLQGQVRIPMLSAALEQFGGGVSVTVRSAARSDVD